ncbi:hypothetical protein KHP62_12980 [Rhodobacteraceae bacterium NNCM2]|nr:hypothetical protein [Coraliihabitans acroporae]
MAAKFVKFERRKIKSPISVAIYALINTWKLDKAFIIRTLFKIAATRSWVVKSEPCIGRSCMADDQHVIVIIGRETAIIVSLPDLELFQAVKIFVGQVAEPSGKMLRRNDVAIRPFFAGLGGLCAEIG